MRKITIHDSFGYITPMDERYRIIREAGFDGVMLGWGGYLDNPHETDMPLADFLRLTYERAVKLRQIMDSSGNGNCE